MAAFDVPVGCSTNPDVISRYARPLRRIKIIRDSEYAGIVTVIGIARTWAGYCDR